MTFSFRYVTGWLLLMGQVVLSIASAEETLSNNKLNLQQAETLALQLDPLIEKSKAEIKAMHGRAVAADTLPDPRLSLGVVNLPTSNYHFDQEPMTQGVIGVSQVLPPWGSLTAQHAKFSALANAASATADDRSLQVLRGLRHSWLSVYYRFHARELIRQSLKEFDQLIEITRSQYRAGRGNQQDVIRAQLEQSLLRDKELQEQAQWQVAQAQLRKWVGAAAQRRELDMSFPYLPDLLQPSRLQEALTQHPAIKVKLSRINATQHDVDVEQARFHPGWMVDVKYGYRSGERDDFLSAMVSMDLPFFTGNRQGQRLSASKAMLSAAKNDLDDLRRAYQQRLDESLAQYRRGMERVALYRDQVMPQAQQNTDAAMKAYQSGVTEFNAVVRARLEQLSSKLNLLKLQVEQARAQTELLYLAGG